jgi:RNA polymerase primary sigma factor
MFTFEDTPWELTLRSLHRGERLSAARFLALMEGEDETAVEDALLDLEQLGVGLDISDLPKFPGTGEAAVRLRREEQLVKQGLLPAALEENDPLRLYLEEVAMTPAFGDEQLLAEKSADGDETAMVALTNLSLSRVIEIAREHVGYGVLLLDLIQEGSLGLWQSIRNWQGGEFIPYRDRWIRFYMAKAVTMQARANGVGQKMRTALEDYRSVDERLLSELGRNPTLEEIAEQLHMTVEAAAAVRKTLENARILAQAKKVPEPEEEAEEEQQAVEDTAYFQSRQRINELLSGLDEEDAKLLSLRFGLEGGLPLSPEDAGKRLGLTPDEVVARETAALAKLRQGS